MIHYFSISTSLFAQKAGRAFSNKTKMSKETFYQTGFYSLIALIVGFVIGSSIPKGHGAENIHRIVSIDTVYADSARKSSFIPTRESVYEELKRQDIKHPRIVLAQSILETGHYQSNVCRANNNLFGLMKKDGYHSFSHWRQSVAYYKEHVQSRYRGGDYYTFLSSIGYAQDPDYINKLKELI